MTLIAGIGVVRMPDLPTRMHASSKAGTLGAIMILCAVALGLGSGPIILRVLLIVAFLFLTAPLAAHAIARAAYGLGVPLSGRTVVDHLARDRARAGESRGEAEG